MLGPGQATCREAPVCCGEAPGCCGAKTKSSETCVVEVLSWILFFLHFFLSADSTARIIKTAAPAPANGPIRLLFELLFISSGVVVGSEIGCGGCVGLGVCVCGCVGLGVCVSGCVDGGCVDGGCVGLGVCVSVCVCGCVGLGVCV
ncbi:MAG: hypothetical protein ACKO47_01295, partial [Alphaproteobacteria bacterium]